MVNGESAVCIVKTQAGLPKKTPTSKSRKNQKEKRKRPAAAAAAGKQAFHLSSLCFCISVFLCLEHDG
jgi:hypothetical protein